MIDVPPMSKIRMSSRAGDARTALPQRRSSDRPTSGISVPLHSEIGVASKLLTRALDVALGGGKFFFVRTYRATPVRSDSLPILHDWSTVFADLRSAESLVLDRRSGVHREEGQSGRKGRQR